MDAKELVLCPWCGSEMHLILVAATAFDGPCDSKYAYQCRKCQSRAPIGYGKEAAYVAAMQRVEPLNRVLTLSEAREADACWEEEIDNAIVLPRKIMIEWFDVPTPQGPDVCMEAFGLTEMYDRPLKQYGKTWRCWMRKPTDEERAAAKWEEQHDED